jgi:hypothetical protein
VNHSRPPTDRELRKMVSRAIRAMGRAPDAEAKRLFDHILAPWQSTSIQKAVAHLPAADENRLLAIALEYRNESRSRVMRDKQRGSARKRSRNLAPRDLWIREQFDQRKHRHRSYSRARFWRDLDLGVLTIPRKFRGQLRPNGRLISAERLREIIKTR